MLVTDMEVPEWLLRIVANYLSGRSLEIWYSNETSTCCQMPGGTAAGIMFGLNFFFYTLWMCRAKTKPYRYWLSNHQTSQQEMTHQLSQSEMEQWCNCMHSNISEVPHNLNTMQVKIDNLAEFTDNHLMALNTKYKIQRQCCVILATNGMSYLN